MEKETSFYKTSIAVREYLDRNKDLVETIDKTSKIHPDLLMGCKNSGLYGMSVPKKYGGAELFFTEIGRWEQYTIHTVQFDVFRYYEELGDSPALTEILAANESQGVSSLLAAGSQEIMERYLGQVARGEAEVAWCLAEARAASDPGAVLSEAVDRGDHWELSGTKTWVTNAQKAQVTNRRLFQ